MELPVVTITIPTYNQEKYISRAIESCLQQDYPNLEIIVSDDCSTDQTFAIASSYRNDKVKVFRTPQNIGRVKNYRYALYNLADGEWVVNLDGDDQYSDPTFISGAIQQLKKYKDCVMYVAGASSLNEATGLVTHSPIYLKEKLTVLKGTDYVLNFYKYGQIGQHFAVLYNRPLALQTDFYTLDSLGADTDSICRLAFKGNVIIQKKWVGVWTSHGNNASYTLDTVRVDKELKMLEHIADAAKAHLPVATVEKWLSESKQLKFKQAVWGSMPKLSFRKAFTELLRHWTWQKQDVKELVKLFIRLFK